MFSRATKTLLKNYIRQTDTHNRMLEESDMWRQHEDHKKRSFEPVRRRHAHMDDYDSGSGGGGATTDRDSGKTSKRGTYWMRQLQDAEEKDPDRWGHSGYKEMHPEEFNSSLSESSDSTTECHKSKKKRKKPKKQKKKKSKDKMKKKRKSKKEPSSKMANNPEKSESSKHKRKRTESESSGSSDDSFIGPKRQKFTSERTSCEQNGHLPSTASQNRFHQSKHKNDVSLADVVWKEKTS